jgi:hypothetical protein
MTSVMTSHPEHTSSEPLLPEVRRMAWPILALTIANGIFLYGLPHLAATWYAWPIKPAINAAFMGTGYLIGVVGIMPTLFVVRSWRSLLVPLNAFFVLAAMHAVVTLMHAEKFRWDYPLTWAWMFVYTTIPIGVVRAHMQQTRVVATNPARKKLYISSPAFLLLGVIIMILAIGLFVMPQALAIVWPWPITPLLARVFSSWYAFMALLLILCATTTRQASELLMTGSMLIVWSVLLLLLPVLHPLEIRVGTPLTVWLGLHFALLAVSTWTTMRAYRAVKLEQQTW